MCILGHGDYSSIAHCQKKNDRFAVMRRFRDRIPVGTRFSARPDRPWGPPILLYNGYRVFPGGKVQPERAADHSPHSSVAVMEE